MASMLLGHLGAEVIKIESQSRLDKIREGGPYPDGPDPDLAGVFASLNSGKKSLTLNLSHPGAAEVVGDLVKHCHVVTNNFKAHTMARFGLSFEALSEHNPKIVYITMSTMGAEGPCTAYGAYGSHLAAMAGINAIAGFPGDVPVGMGALFPDFSCNPLHATAAIIAGLRHAEETGTGVDIDIAQLESTIHLIGPILKQVSLTGEQPPRIGVRHAWRVPHGVYPCLGDDEWLALSVGTDAQWDALVATISPDLPGDWTRRRTFLARQRDQDQIDGVIRSWTTRRNKWDAARALVAAGVPAWPVNNLHDQVDVDPVLTHEYVRVAVAETVEAIYQRAPFAYAGAPEPARPPRLAEHNFELLQDLAGYSGEKIAELVGSGVLD